MQKNPAKAKFCCCGGLVGEMSSVRSVLSNWLPFLGDETSDGLPDEVVEAKPCEGLNECLYEAFNKLAPDEGPVNFWTVLHQIQNDFILSRVLLLLQISLVCIFLRGHIIAASKRLYSFGCRAWRQVGRFMASEDIQKADQEIEDLRILNLNVSKIAQTKLAVLEKRLDALSEEKQLIRDDLSSFKETVIENQKEHLELTKRWAKHVEEITDRSKGSEARRAAAIKKGTGIPVLLNSPRRPSLKVTNGRQQ